MLFMIVKMMVMIMMMMMMMMMIQIHEVVDNRGNAITVMVTIMKVPMCFFCARVFTVNLLRFKPLKPPGVAHFFFRHIMTGDFDDW